MTVCEVCHERPAAITLIVSEHEGIRRRHLCDHCQRNVRPPKPRPSVTSVGNLFGPHYAEASFDTFKTNHDNAFFAEYNRRERRGEYQYSQAMLEALGAIRLSVETFTDSMVRSRSGRLFMSGRAGTGKTHLLAAAVQRLLEEGLSVVVYSAYDFVADMLATHASRQFAERQVQGDIIARLSSHDCVVIDDLNPEIITDSTPRYIGWLFAELTRRDRILMVASQFSYKKLSEQKIGSSPGLGDGIMDRLLSEPSRLIDFPILPSYRHVQSVMRGYEY